MSAQEKLTLVLELSNKLFNNKLMQTKRKLEKTTKKMRGNIDKLKNNTTASFKTMGAKLDAFKIKTVRSWQAMRNEIPLFGRAMELLGNPYVLVAAGLMATIGLFANATGYAKRFNHEFLQIRNLNLDKSQESLNNYKNLIRDTAFETGQNLEKSTIAFYDLQSATGLYGKSAENVFKKVAKYSTATGADLNDSINMTTKAMKAFGLTEKDIDTYLASNAKTVQTGIVNFKELAQVQTEFAGAAAGAGQSVDTANKLFAVFTSITKDARMGATMTKTAFLGLTQESTIKGLKSIGVQLYDANGKMRDLGDILSDVKDKFKNMSPQEIDQLINKIGGPEGLRNMFIKLKTNAADFEKTMATFDNSKFNLDKAFKNAREEATVMGDMVKNKFGALMARLGEVTLPLVNKVLRGINATLDWMYQHWNDIADVLESVGIAVSIVGGYFAISAISAIGFSGALGMVTFGLHAIKTAIFSIPIVGWIMLAITAIALLIKKTEGWKKQWKNMSAFVRDIFHIIGLSIKISIKKIVDDFMNKVEVIKKAYYKLRLAMGIGNEEANKKALAEIRDNSADRKSELAMMQAELDSAVRNRRKFEWKLSWKKKPENEEETQNSPAGTSPTALATGDLLNTDNTNTDTPGGNTDNGLSKVTGKASAPRSIVINIDSFVKGGINVNQEQFNQMDKDELRKWFEEMFLRVTRNVELSNG